MNFRKSLLVKSAVFFPIILAYCTIGSVVGFEFVRGVYALVAIVVFFLFSPLFDCTNNGTANENDDDTAADDCEQRFHAITKQEVSLCEYSHDCEYSR